MTVLAPEQSPPAIVREPRSSLFLAAILRAGPEQAPVKVRNLSPHGAMLETPLTPPPGMQVHLVRGALLAHGTIMWSSHNRCGLRLNSEVSVKDWMAAPTKNEQLRVDEIVASVRNGAPSPTIARLVGAQAPHRPGDDSDLADDLTAVVKLLQDLEDDLASSDETLARHAVKLQNLDIAMQMVRAVARQVAPNPGDHESLAKLADLRVSCAQVLGMK